MDISGNIHCVLNNINKIILAQKLETFLTNILSKAWVVGLVRTTPLKSYFQPL